VNLRDLTEDDLPAAASLLANGLRDNPLYMTVIDRSTEDRERALTRLFEGAVRRVFRGGALEGAFEDERLVGVCGRVAPGECRLGFFERLMIVPSLAMRHSLSIALRLHELAAEFTRRDPSHPHWHFGPLAVPRSMRGKGIGTALLRSFCARMDRERTAAYLETDRDANVPFYEREGFSVARREPVLGVPCWFMTRASRAGEREHFS